MKPWTLTARSLTYFWRTHAAVVVGVATAIAVLTGALLVGDSVRGSLRDLVLIRLGRTDQVVVSTGFFQEALADDIRTRPQFGTLFDGIVPIILTRGFVRTQIGNAQAGPVRVYGVDTRFWDFHGMAGVSGPEGREARLSPALARDLDVGVGDTILVRVERPTEMPTESVFGEKDDLGQTVRASVGRILPQDELGEFSLGATQGDIRAVFLPLALLQDELEVPGGATALLVSGMPDSRATSALEQLVRDAATLGDLGLRVRVVGDSDTIAVESEHGLLEDPVAGELFETGAENGLDSQPVLTWLANSIEGQAKAIPYSLVSAIDLAAFAPDLTLPAEGELPPIVLTDWAARDLGVGPGDRITLRYYLWQDSGRLAADSADFVFAGTVPVEHGDPDLAPKFPGISDALNLADWNPPFPIDLSRIRPADEDYWDRYRTTPKAYIPIETGQQLWRSRFGSLTSVRFPLAGTDRSAIALAPEIEAQLARRIDPFDAGFAVAGVRSGGLDASSGTINFSEYFIYFSFFLVVSALLVAALFFKLSVEQRASEVGLLRAVGFSPRDVRRFFLKEGLWLSLAGAGLGVLGGVGYARLIVAALGTWWVGAVGTSHLTLHLSGLSLAAGFAGGILAALGCIWITLRSLSHVSERRLLAGQLAPESTRNGGRKSLMLAVGSFLLGLALVAATLIGWIPEAGGFFGAGSALLVGCLSLFLYASRRPRRHTLDGASLWPVTRLGLRNVTWRPSRSVVSMAMIASATFVLVSVDAFRTETIDETGRQSGVGGYDFIVETLLPVVYDPESPEGRDLLGIGNSGTTRIEPFRYRPGDDTSCLNLYAPQNPRIIAPPESFTEEGRFRFADSLADTAEERQNPWRLLDGVLEDGAIPVIADTHSITYVLNRVLGDDIVITDGDEPLRLRLVAALSDSIFQGELLMSADNFRRAFPDIAGYQYLLVETDPSDRANVGEAIANALEDHGVAVTSTTERLAGFHEVENTYLSTFQSLGALGLLLGTVGLGAVLLRNVMERRQELALLRALGYKRPDFVAMAMAENTLLLAGGLFSGILCALVAIGPAVTDRGGRLPGELLLLLLAGVLALGLITSLVATMIALKSPLLSALRAE